MTHANTGFTLEWRDGVLMLAGQLDIYCAEEFRRTLAEHLDGAPSLTIDLSRVAACDITAPVLPNTLATAPPPPTAAVPAPLTTQ